MLRVGPGAYGSFVPMTKWAPHPEGVLRLFKGPLLGYVCSLVPRGQVGFRGHVQRPVEGTSLELGQSRSAGSWALLGSASCIIDLPPAMDVNNSSGKEVLRMANRGLSAPPQLPAPSSQLGAYCSSLTALLGGSC